MHHFFNVILLANQYQVTAVNSGVNHRMTLCAKPKVFAFADEIGGDRKRIVVMLFCIDQRTTGNVPADGRVEFAL